MVGRKQALHQRPKEVPVCDNIYFSFPCEEPGIEGKTQKSPHLLPF